MGELITITKAEYMRLKERDEFLSCLEAEGVDNWSGYGDAQQAFQDCEDGHEEYRDVGDDDGEHD
jgi:hypothetical protein